MAISILASLIALIHEDLGSTTIAINGSTKFDDDLHYADESLIEFFKVRVLGKWPDIKVIPEEVIACKQVIDMAKLITRKLPIKP